MRPDPVLVAALERECRAGGDRVGIIMCEITRGKYDWADIGDRRFDVLDAYAEVERMLAEAAAQYGVELDG